MSFLRDWLASSWVGQNFHMWQDRLFVRDNESAAETYEAASRDEIETIL